MDSPTNKVYLICRSYENVKTDFKLPAHATPELGLYSSESQALEAVIQLMELNAALKNQQENYKDFLDKIKKSETFGQLNEILKSQARVVIPKLGEGMKYGTENPFDKPKGVNMFGFHAFGADSLHYYQYSVVEVCMDSIPFKIIDPSL
jgi:hypothetical protein